MISPHHSPHAFTSSPWSQQTHRSQEGVGAIHTERRQRLVMCRSRTVPRRRARSSPRRRARATRQQQVPERRRPERRRPLPAALRRGGRPGGLQAQHAPHHLDVVVPAGLHVPVEVHDPSALCVAAGNVQRKGKVLVWTETLLDDIALANTFIACHRSYTSDHSFHQKQKMYP